MYRCRWLSWLLFGRPILVYGSYWGHTRWRDGKGSLIGSLMWSNGESTFTQSFTSTICLVVFATLTQRWILVVQSHDVDTPLYQRCIDVVCLLGHTYIAYYFWNLNNIISYNISNNYYATNWIVVFRNSIHIYIVVVSQLSVIGK